MSHAAFLADIIAHPDDDAPRLIYADWLEERGGADNEARAEFIRVQCQIASTPPLPLLPPLANPRLVRDAKPICWNDTTPDDYRIRAVGWLCLTEGFCPTDRVSASRISALASARQRIPADSRDRMSE